MTDVLFFVALTCIPLGMLIGLWWGSREGKRYSRAMDDHLAKAVEHEARSIQLLGEVEDLLDEAQQIRTEAVAIRLDARRERTRLASLWGVS